MTKSNRLWGNAMRAHAFLEAFAGAFSEARDKAPDLLAQYAHSRSWTPFMLGEAPPGVLRVAARRWSEACGCGQADVSLHAQWYTLDLCVVTPAYLGAGDYWNSRTVLAIEHENDSDVETEMWKLAHWRADLSVLVFYDFSEAECASDAPCDDKWLPGVTKRNWLTQKCERLSGIVRRIDASHAERHLLLIGQRGGAASDAIAWRYCRWLDGQFEPPRAL